MEELRQAVIQKMCEFLSDEQIEKLGNVLDVVLYNFEIKVKKEEIVVYDDNNIAKLKKFIATKRLEGLSEDTLMQYYRAVYNLFTEVGKPLEEINTDDIRYYLSMYQEQRKVCKVTDFSDISTYKKECYESTLYFLYICILNNKESIFFH